MTIVLDTRGPQANSLAKSRGDGAGSVQVRLDPALTIDTGAKVFAVCGKGGNC
jgi:hypothetical protein